MRDPNRGSPGANEAARLHTKAARRVPTDDDRPRRPSTFRGKKHKPLPGQLDLGGGETPGLPPAERDEPA